MEDAIRRDIEAIEAIPAVPRILQVLCRTTGMGFAAVARVTDTRWVCCAAQDEIGFGLRPGSELKIETTICNEIRGSREPVLIDHVETDPAFRNHPTRAMYGFQSYVSVPILLSDGSMFGTLCAIDPKPAKVSRPGIREMFELFAEMIAFQIETQRQIEQSDAILVTERTASELREQFIAVLGHDLRNPLASIVAGIRLLGKPSNKDKGPEILVTMHKSVMRMSVLIDNLLDFARGRLGGGISLDRTPCDLGTVLHDVIAEFRMVHPERAIEAAIRLDRPVDCDRQRIGQLFANLLGNALNHGAPDLPVRVSARQNGVLDLSISNGGAAIPPAILQNLFKPFRRGELVKSQKGLGLGLYIASEIAKAHGGTLEAQSTPAETRFTFSMPLSR